MVSYLVVKWFTSMVTMVTNTSLICHRRIEDSQEDYSERLLYRPNNDDQIRETLVPLSMMH
jgi:hypothetical protein